MSNEKLLPCPFCSGEARLVLDKDGMGFVECMFCPIAITEWSTDVGYLVKTWNTRHEPKREFVVNEAVNAAIQLAQTIKNIQNGKQVVADESKQFLIEGGNNRVRQPVDVSVINNTGKPILVEQGENTVSIVVNQTKGGE